VRKLGKEEIALGALIPISIGLGIYALFKKKKEALTQNPSDIPLYDGTTITPIDTTDIDISQEVLVTQDQITTIVENGATDVAIKIQELQNLEKDVVISKEKTQESINRLINEINTLKATVKANLPQYDSLNATANGIKNQINTLESTRTIMYTIFAQAKNESDLALQNVAKYQYIENALYVANRFENMLNDSYHEGYIYYQGVKTEFAYNWDATTTAVRQSQASTLAAKYESNFSNLNTITQKYSNEYVNLENEIATLTNRYNEAKSVADLYYRDNITFYNQQIVSKEQTLSQIQIALDVINERLAELRLDIARLK
jgi:uncharacterized coiled-coil DUF342 family protein